MTDKIKLSSSPNHEKKIQKKKEVCNEISRSVKKILDSIDFSPPNPINQKLKLNQNCFQNLKRKQKKT